MNSTSTHKKRQLHQTTVEQTDSLLAPFRGERMTIFLSSVVINFLALAFPLLMLQIYDRILPHQSVDTLGLVAATVGLAIAVESILRVARSYTTAWIAARFEHRAMMELTDRILAEPLPDFERKGTGAIMSLFKSVSVLKYHYSGQSFQQLLDLPFTALYVTIVAIMSPLMGLLLLVGYSIFVCITWKNGRKFPALVKEQQTADLRRGNFLNETFINVHTLKSMTMESLMLRRHERLQENCARLMARMTYALDMSAGIGNVFSPLMTMLTVALGAWLVIHGRLTNGELAACVLLGMRSLSPLQRLGGLWAKHQQDMVSRHALTEVLTQRALPKSQAEPVLQSSELQPTASNSSGVRFENVSFRYPGTQTDIFKDINLEIQPGDCLVIAGNSGEGRSTLLKLISGVLESDTGRVLFDDQDIRLYQSSLRSRLVAYLSQDAVMFEGTLLDNISVFDPARVRNALHVAKELGLTDFVLKMPRGWDSIVGDMASDSLPPGFRQRISIVRALSNHPSVILFDEATSTMDAEGDALFLNYLKSILGQVTIVIVSQKMAYQNLATRTLFLNAGKLTEVSSGSISVLTEANSPNGTSSLIEKRNLSNSFLPAGYSQSDNELFLESSGLNDESESQRWEKMHETINRQFMVETDFAGCLSVLLRLLNAHGSAREVAESLPYFTDALDLPGFHNAMAQLGYRMTEVRCKLGDVPSTSMPCLFVPEHALSFVAIGRSGQSVRINTDPTQEIRFESNQSLKGCAYFYEAVETTSIQTTSWVRRAIFRFRPLILQATLSALVSGMVMMAGPLFMTVIYSTVIPSGAKDTLFYLTIGASIALLSGYAFMRHRARILSYIAGRVEYLFGATILQQVLRMSPAYTEKASVASQTARLQSFDVIRDMFTGSLASTLLESPATFVLLIALSILNPIALLIFVLMVALYGLFYWIFSSPSKLRMQELSRASTQRNEFLLEMIGKMRAVRECSAQQLWLERFRDISANATMASFKSEQLSSLLVSISYFVMMCSALAIVAATVPAVWSQTVSSGALIASLMLMWRVLNPIQTMFTSMSRIERIHAAVNQIDGLMRIRGERPDTNVGVIPRNIQGHVEFARVSFRYSMNVDPALVGVEFRVKPGELVAITGANGSGKSTLFKLILGMYQPQAGAVLIDNIDIRQLDPLSLRRAVGYTPQDTQLFRATIAQNLRLVRPDASDEELYQTLDMAGALEYVMSLPKGLGYRVGDNTNDLPASLRQKISLARTFLTRAPIMLFDEPGAGMDEAGDMKLMLALQKLKGKTTILFISHRPSLIRLADTLLVFDKGYLRAAGPPDVLLQKQVAA